MKTVERISLVFVLMTKHISAVSQVRKHEDSMQIGADDTIEIDHGLDDPAPKVLPSLVRSVEVDASGNINAADDRGTTMIARSIMAGQEPAVGTEALQDSVSGSDISVAQNKEGLCQARPYVAGSTILIIGDSQADAAGPQSTQGLAQPIDTLGKACGGKSATNRGCGGSKASEWIANNGEMITTAVSTGVGTNPPWTHVWISLGGNDQTEQLCRTGEAPTCQGFGPRCSTGAANMNELRRRLNATAQHVKRLAPQAKIVFTGYAVTGMDDSCVSEVIGAGTAAIQKELAQNDSMITFASIGTAACGETDLTKRAAAGCTPASPNKVTPCFGDGKYFRGHSTTPAAEKTPGDFFHLNAAGYERAWTTPDVQSAFGCTPVAPAPSQCPVPAPTPPPTAPVSVCPGSAAGSQSTDNNTGVAAEAAAAGAPQFKTCDSVRAFCHDPTHGDKVKKHCCCPAWPR